MLSVFGQEVSSPFDKIWPPKNWHFLPPRSHFWGYWLALIGFLGLKWSPSIADQSLFQVDAHKHKDWPTKKMKDILLQDRAKLPKIRYARNAKLARVQTCWKGWFSQHFIGIEISWGLPKESWCSLQTICLPRNLLKTDFSLKMAIYKFLAKHNWPAQRWCMCILQWLVRPWLCNTCGNCNGNVCMHGGILTQAIFFGVNSSIDLCITFLNFGHWPNYTRPTLPHACNLGKYFHFSWRQMLYHISKWLKKPYIDLGGNYLFE